MANENPVGGRTSRTRAIANGSNVPAVPVAPDGYNSVIGVPGGVLPGRFDPDAAGPGPAERPTQGTRPRVAPFKL